MYICFTKEYVSVIGTKKSDIDGTTVAIKDNICTSFLPTTCASNMLKGKKKKKKN
jgi:Asp-tRNA(Asn)/Glu-tRNA(Gln) amidotransferase A subunit family amidase